MTPFVHVSIRQRSSADSLLVDDRPAWLWHALRRLWPDALAACLMRDHAHLIAEVRDDDRRRLTTLLGNYTRRFGFPRGHWLPVDEPVPIRHRTMLGLSVRYVVLNPCRSRHCRDPLAWRWSTHREVVGAVARPWVSAARLAHAIGRPATGFVEQHHRFVSGDPHVSVASTPPPRVTDTRAVADVPLERIALAAAAAFRVEPDAIKQRGPVRATFIALAAHQGWRDRHALMHAAGCSRATVGRLLAAPCEPAALDAARVCLGDDRLLFPLGA